MKNRNAFVTPTLVATVIVLLGLFQAACTESSDSTQKLEIYTEISAAGDSLPIPQTMPFPTFDPPKLLWITGVSTEMVNPDGSPVTDGPAYRTDVGFEYMRHARIHHLPVYHTDRLFTLTPRQSHVALPAEFGLPFYSDELLTLTVTPLTTSQPDKSSGLRKKTVLEYVLDEDLDQPLKPLFAASGRWTQSREGGRDRVLRLPYDTHAHYITAPLHPHADSFELRDLSTGEIVYNCARAAGEAAADTEDGSCFSDAAGVELLQDRSYLLVDGLESSASEESDLSAAALFYLRDKQFKKRPREGAPVAHFENPIKTADEMLILHTNHGKIEIAFYPEVAPRHYKQIAHLARLGVYDGVLFHRVEPEFLVQLGFPETRRDPPLSDEQRAALRRLEAEFSDLPMKRWTVAMALRDNADPDSAVASFFILLETTRRIDQQYTIIGRIISGLGTLNKIAALPLKDAQPIEPAFIEKAEIKTVEQITAGRKGRLKRSGSTQGK